MPPSSRSLAVTRPAAIASGLARMEARRLGHQYLGPEHLLLGLPAEARGITVDRLPSAVLEELDQPP